MSNLADQVRKEFSRWLSLPNYDTVDIVAATLLANRLPGKAVWLAIVGPPATGKTEIVQALSGCLNVHPLGRITPATFVSGFKTSKTSSEHHGILSQMTDGQPHMIVVKDFSTVLQKRQEVRGEILSGLRDLYDGEIDAFYGNKLSIAWRGKVGMIVCSTGQYDKEIKALSTFGDRFLVFRPLEGKRKPLAERAARNAGQIDKMRIDLEKAYSLLDKIKIPRKEIWVSLEARNMIASLSDFVTRARSPISRDWRTREVDELPELEGTARVAVQLNQLARGVVLYHERDKVEESDVEMLESLVFSTIPFARSLVLSGMDLGGKTSGNELARTLGIPQTLVTRCLEDLCLLGIVIWVGGSTRSPKGGWGVIKEWKVFVDKLSSWVEGRR